MHCQIDSDRIIKAQINKRWWEILLTDVSPILEAVFSQFGLKWKRNNFQSTYPFCFVSRLSTFVCRFVWVPDDSWLTHTVNQEISSTMLFGSKVTKKWNHLNIDTWLLSAYFYVSFAFNDETKIFRILLVSSILSTMLDCAMGIAAFKLYRELKGACLDQAPKHWDSPINDPYCFRDGKDRQKE